MRIFLLLFFSVGLIRAFPNNAEEALKNVQRTADDSGSYGTSSGDVDDSFLDEVFGTGNQVEDYVPPSKQTVDTTSEFCTDYENLGFECVQYYQCDEYGEIITDGGPGLIDIRFGGAGGNVSEKNSPNRPNIELDAENSKCTGYLEVCCRNPDAPPVTTPRPTTQRPTPPPYQRRCGKHNVDGVGVRIQNYGDGGGEFSTQFGEWPHMCAVLEKKNGKNNYLCGGSLIDEGIVMTAAHCVHNKEYGNLKVRCGEWDTQRQIEPIKHQDRDIYNMRVHPGFSARNLSNDVALLFTDSNDPFILSSHIDTICLPSKIKGRNKYSYERQNCVATGWGKDEFGSEGEYQVILKQVELNVWDSKKQCENKLQTTRLGKRFQLHKSFLCAGGLGGVDTCKGDGGGPLVCPTGEYHDDGYGVSIPLYEQAGIVAWGIGCGEEGVPGVYVDVEEMLCFIDWSTRCVRGADYDAYDVTCGNRWAKKQRNQVMKNMKLYRKELEQTNRPGRKRKLPHIINAHQVAIDSWNGQIDTCSNYASDSVSDDYGDTDDGYDYYDDYNNPDIGGDARTGAEPNADIRSATGDVNQDGEGEEETEGQQRR